jgi:membrane protein YdbS with pleckstrin-like domain
MSSDLIGLGPESLAARRARVALGTGAFLIVGVIGTFFARRFGVDLPFWVAPVAVLGLGAISWWWTGLEHGRWAWGLNEDLLEVRRGVLVRRVYLVPRNRIQNVTTTTGPLQNRFGILSLAVHTAGARTRSVVIEDLDAGHAASIRRRLGLQ